MTEQERELYRLVHEQGKRRFGSPCRHTVVVRGICANCLRKVL